MTQKEFIDVIKEVFPSCMDILGPETRYMDLSDWNSMTALVLITTLGERFDVSVSPNEVMEHETLGSLFQFICKSGNSHSIL